jgi:predicted nucleotidyltransferase
VLTQSQLDDLACLQALAEEFKAKFAIIGAAALECFIDLDSFTTDVDLVLALDLEDFARFTERLRIRGWIRDSQKEHRWYGPKGSLVDLLPAGPRLRAARRLIWPVSRFEMSLVGFRHVFEQSPLFSFAEDARYRVAPPAVVGLLKIVAFMQDRYGRRKDLLHLQTLFGAYEKSSDRMFGDDVLAAELQDIEYASAYLLGKDIGTLADSEELEILHQFLQQELFSDDELSEMNGQDNWAAVRAQQQLRAFRKGLNHGRGL